MASEVDAEVAALGKMFDLLSGLDPDQQERALRYLWARFCGDVKLPGVSSMASAGRVPPDDGLGDAQPEHRRRHRR